MEIQIKNYLTKNYINIDLKFKIKISKYTNEYVKN